VIERVGPIIDCLRVSVADRCNMRCLYCMPSVGISPLPRQEILRFEEIVALARFLRERYGLRTVRLTGGEPLLRRRIERLVEMLSDSGVEDIALTTNGQLLPEMAASLRRAGIGRINISLDSLRPDCFARLTRGGQLGRALDGIEAARAAGLRSVKLNTVVLRGMNDTEVCDLLHFAMERGLEIRFLELMAIGAAARRHRAWFVPSHEVIQQLESRFELEPLESIAGHSARMYIARNSGGQATRVGFISPETQPFCADCRRLRVTSDGHLLACLMHSSGPHLLPSLRRSGGPNYETIDRAIRASLARKPVVRERFSPQLMAAIGG